MKMSSNRPSRRQVLRAGVATAALLASPRLLQHAIGAQPRRPNILLLVTDDQRAESLGCAGNRIIKTPNIDALAQRGVRFSNSFATTAICMSSRASLLTGMYTRVHGVDDFIKPLAVNLLNKSYPHLLHQNGYRTGFIGKWGVDAGAMPTEDFDFFRGYQGQGRYFSPGEKKHLTVIQTEQAIEFLRGCTQHQPFCLAVSFKASHVQDEGRYLPGIYAKYPYDPALSDYYKDDVVPAVATKDAQRWPLMFERSMNHTREGPDFSAPNYQQTMKSLYRLLTGVDLAVGQILGQLKSLGLDENTAIIFTSDHGSFYGEHGFGGKWLMHEEAIRTPMIVCDPTLPIDRRGVVCPQMALNIDVPATVLDLAGITKTIGMQGRSLLPLARGQTPAWRSEWFYENHFRNAKTEPILASEGIRTQRWKFIRYIDTDPPYEQLFDLKTDPREQINLASDPTYRDQLNDLRSRWQRWQKSLDRFSTDQQWIDPVG
jgi:arylsulfatase A-like enzyme